MCERETEGETGDRDSLKEWEDVRRDYRTRDKETKRVSEHITEPEAHERQHLRERREAVAGCPSPHTALLPPVFETPELVSSLAGLGGAAWVCIPDAPGLGRDVSGLHVGERETGSWGQPERGREWG